MIKVAVTGGIGSGKSTVCRMFGVLGIPVFEADVVAKHLMISDPALRAALKSRFGHEVLTEQGLDRKRLAALVFNDRAALSDLNGIVHPAVRKAFLKWSTEQTAPYVIMEAAILAETGGHGGFDHVVLVSASEEVRIARVMQRDSVGEEAVRARIRNQATDAERERIAHHIIINDGRQLVIPQVLALHELLRA